MKNYSWSNVFSNNDWIINSNSLPTLKQTLDEYNLRAIDIIIKNQKYFKGDIIEFTTNIYPTSLENEFKDFISYELEGEGFIRIGNKIYTENANSNSFTLTASIVNKKQVISSSKTININTPLESLVINHNLEYLEAGKRYKLNADILPLENNDNISYRLSSSYLGVSIDENILTIADECNTNTISFYAISESGTKSQTVSLPVKTQTIVPSGTITIYEKENNNLEFIFDSSTNLLDAKVYVFNKEVNYELENNKITISRSILENYKDTTARFIFKLKDNTTFGIDAYYFSHERYTLEMFNNEEVIRINSIEDYFKYFNADPSRTYDSSKTDNYSKTFVLTTDLDFEGKEIYAIGYGDKKFSGKFYGLGHTISNFKIRKNEKVNIENSTSCLYGVGLFAALSGSIYDLKLKDGNVRGNNFIGGLVGMLTTGYIENCQGENLNVATLNNIQISEDDINVGKIVGKSWTGRVICSYHNNISLNTIG